MQALQRLWPIRQECSLQPDGSRQVTPVTGCNSWLVSPAAIIAFIECLAFGPLQHSCRPMIGFRTAHMPAWLQLLLCQCDSKVTSEQHEHVPWCVHKTEGAASWHK
jgi:hypothetical protein